MCCMNTTHRQSATSYYHQHHYAHPRTASDDLSYAMHSMHIQQQQQQQHAEQHSAFQQPQQHWEASAGYSESVGSDPAAGAVRATRQPVVFQQFHGAEGSHIPRPRHHIVLRGR